LIDSKAASASPARRPRDVSEARCCRKRKVDCMAVPRPAGGSARRRTLRRATAAAVPRAFTNPAAQPHEGPLEHNAGRRTPQADAPAQTAASPRLPRATRYAAAPPAKVAVTHLSNSPARACIAAQYDRTRNSLDARSRKWALPL